jgi:hypothetical protein
MSRRLKIWAIAPLLPMLWSCGYVGEPLPPALNIPLVVDDLSARQAGARIMVAFTLPSLTTEQTVLRAPGKIELRAGPPPNNGSDMNSWSGGAKQIPVTAGEFGVVETSFPASEFAGSRIVLAVRSAGPGDRFSAWSNIVTLNVVKPLPAPVDFKAEAASGGVKLSWRLPESRTGVTYNVLRKAQQDKAPVSAGSSDTDSFLDAAAEYGRTYEYSVQAMEKAGDSLAVGDMSATVSITPDDKFPPAMPTGLTALAGLNTAELNWERVTDSDLAGYRIYRAEGGGEFKRISDTLSVPGFSDAGVASGKKYRYQVTSIDVKGNESGPSAAVEISIP